MSSELERAAARFRAELLRNEADAAARMIAAYGAAYARISEQLQRLTERQEEARRSGQFPGLSWLYQQDRLEQLVTLVAAEISAFADQAGATITAQQAAAVTQARTHAAELIRVALGPAAERYAPFVTLPTSATEKMVGHLANGSPLRTLLDQLGPEAAESAKKRLVVGVATGQGPKAIAAGLREDLGGNLNRALTVARTETLRAYRESSRETYQANEELLEGWVWLAHLGPRTCASCLAMHGTVHPLSEPMGTHPNCRCSAAPKSKGLESLGINGLPPRQPVETGAEWLRRQPQPVQASILGDAGAAAWRSGEVRLSDFVKRTRSPEWGVSRTARGVRGARIAAEKRQR